VRECEIMGFIKHPQLKVDEIQIVIQKAKEFFENELTTTKLLCLIPIELQLSLLKALV
jgi:hypothetical protein